MKQIPSWRAWMQVGLTAFVLLSMASIVFYAPFWLVAGLRKKRRRPAERAIRVWPLAAVLSLLAIVAIFIWLPDDVSTLGHLTVWSGGICLATVAFALSAIASAVALWRSRGQAVRPGVYRYSTVVTVALLIAAAYLAWWGVIGVRTWA